MDTEILNLDLSADDEHLGSMEMMFFVEDGKVTGCQLGHMKLDAVFALAFLDAIATTFKTSPTTLAH